MGDTCTLEKVVSCGALTWRSERPGNIDILLIKQFRNNKKWGIPKGHINACESFEECARREVFEETGITVVLGERLPDCRIETKKEDKTVVTFLATPVGSTEVKFPAYELADANWFNIEKLPLIQTYQQDVVNAAVEKLSEFATKARIEGTLRGMHEYAHSIKDWVSLKKELMLMLKSADRRVFTTRDPVTKKQHMNEYERHLAALWTEITGKKLILSE